MTVKRTRKLGKFKIDGMFWQEHPIPYGLFKDVIVLRTKDEINTDSIEYIAVCEDFDEISYGELIPEYEPLFEFYKNGKVKKVNWLRIK